MIKNWYLLLLLLLLMSCDNKIAKDINQIKSEKIIIPLNDFTCWKNDTLVDFTQFQNISKYPFKYIVYIDSSLCSTCNISQLYHWNEFINKYDSIDFYFILAPKNKSEAKILPKYLSRSQLELPIYIDEHFAFLNKNPHIPNNNMYHCILLDRNDSAILIGNPLFNPKIEKLLSEELNK